MTGLDISSEKLVWRSGRTAAAQMPRAPPRPARTQQQRRADEYGSAEA
jgi:hypothetical protein